MGMRLFKIRPPLRLGTRIAATTLAAILAVQAINAAAFFLLPPPRLTVYGARWLVEKTEEIAPAVFAAGEDERAGLATEKGNQLGLRVRWEPSPHHVPLEATEDSSFFLLKRVCASLEKDLQGKIRSVILYRHERPFGPGHRPPLEFGRQLGLGPIRTDEGDNPIVGHFEIGIQGLDGSWLFIEPLKQPRLPFLHPWFVTMIGAVLLVSALSAVTARRAIGRLDRLVEAARKMGRTRDATPIDTAGLNEFEEIAVALNELQARNRQFLDERTQMLAAISHDLRTSLTRLRLDAEDLPENETKNRLIVDLYEMERMISATLTFAGDDLRKEPQKRVDVAALLISLCDSFSDRGQDAAYSGPNHAYVLCQPVAMKRAFDNLIGNAIKYGARAHVALSPGGGAPLISIRDDGPGIQEDMMEIVFRPFRRLETSRNRESGGVGLGLTIARDIIRAHGGEITLRNHPDGGLEVLVQLAGAPKAAGEKNREPQPAVSASESVSGLNARGRPQR